MRLWKSMFSFSHISSHSESAISAELFIFTINCVDFAIFNSILIKFLKALLIKLECLTSISSNLYLADSLNFRSPWKVKLHSSNRIFVSALIELIIICWTLPCYHTQNLWISIFYECLQLICIFDYTSYFVNDW